MSSPPERTAREVEEEFRALVSMLRAEAGLEDIRRHAAEEVDRFMDTVRGGLDRRAFEEIWGEAEKLADAMSLQQPMNLDTWYWRMVKKWFQRGRSYQDRFFAFFETHNSETVKQMLTATIWIQDGGAWKSIHRQITPYDMLEYIITITALKDREMRREIVDAAINAMRLAKIEHEGKTVTFDQFLRMQGISWQDFEEHMKQKLENSIDRYLEFLENPNMKGSRIALHTIYREQHASDPDAIWFLHVSSSLQAGIAASLTAAHIERKQKYASAPYRVRLLNRGLPYHPGLGYIKAMHHFGVFTSKIAQREAHIITAMKPRFHRLVHPPRVDIYDLDPEKLDPQAMRRIVDKALFSAIAYEKQAYEEMLPERFKQRFENVVTAGTAKEALKHMVREREKKEEELNTA